MHMKLLDKKANSIRSLGLFVLAGFILFTFFLIRSENSFDYFTNEYSGEAPVLLNNEVPIKQDIPKDIDAINSISIQFGTFNRVNTGNLIITLYEDDNVIEQWDQNTADLLDGWYSDFELSDTCVLENSHNYYFTIEDQYDGDNGIAVWAAGSNGTIDNLCYRLCCTDLKMQKTVMVTGIIVLAILSILLLFKVDERIIMLLMMSFFIMILVRICPYGTLPDEHLHFLRAYEIAHGNMISQNFGKLGGGNVLPDALRLAFSDKTAVIDWGKTSKFYFPNTSLYAPVSYIPQATGIAIAELFTDKAYYVFLGGRIGGAFFCIALSAVSMWLIPYGRKFLFLAMVFPLTLQEMAAISPDGFTISLALLLFSYVLYIRCREGKIKKRDIVVLVTVCLLLSLCKIVYFVLVLLVLLIPKEKYENKKNRAIFNASVIIASIAANLVWLKISSGYLMEFQPGVDSFAQVRGIFSNPFNYYLVVVRTLLENSVFYVQSMIGSYMGSMNIVITPFVCTSYLIMLVALMVGNSERMPDIRKADKYILFSIFVLCSALIFTSLYVQWTSLGNDMVVGIQGRYFTPIIPVLAFGIMYCIREHDERGGYAHKPGPGGSYYYLFLLLFNGITMLDMIKYYLITN